MWGIPGGFYRIFLPFSEPLNNLLSLQLKRKAENGRPTNGEDSRLMVCGHSHSHYNSIVSLYIATFRGSSQFCVLYVFLSKSFLNFIVFRSVTKSSRQVCMLFVVWRAVESRAPSVIENAQQTNFKLFSNINVRFLIGRPAPRHFAYFSIFSLDHQNCSKQYRKKDPFLSCTCRTFYKWLSFNFHSCDRNPHHAMWSAQVTTSEIDL
jgi:hypothetical protein